MAKFYGTVQGNRGMVTRIGTQDIKASAQSWDGSVIMRLWYNANNELMVNLSVNEGSSNSGYTKFHNTFDKFNQLMNLVMSLGVDDTIKLLSEENKNREEIIGGKYE